MMKARLSPRLFFIFPLLLLFLAACATHQSVQKTIIETKSTIQLREAIQKYTDATKHLDAFEAAYFNIEEDLSRFGDYPAPDYFVRAKRMVQDALQGLIGINILELDAKDRLTYRLFKEDMEVGLRGYDFPSEYLSVNQMGNRLHEYMDSSSEALTSFPFDSVKHYRDYLKRSDGLPKYVDRQIDLMRRGIKKKVVLSCTVAGKVPHTYQDALERQVEKNPFYRPVLFMPQSFSESERKSLTNEFRLMITKTILPSYAKFDAFYHNEYLKHCRIGFGLSTLPQGRDWYLHEIRASTDLDLNPNEIHQTGLLEVARISAELEKIKKQAGFKGSIRDFMLSRANDSRSYFSTSAELFSAFKRVKAEVARRIPSYFSLVPRSEFKLVETSNPDDAAGSYNQPTENAPFGRFLVNTKNLHSVPIYEVTTLLMHETVPGHHFQLALQYEMKDTLSEYRRKIYSSNAFEEGWALYSEYLGNEMGMYADPMQRFGNLNEEMLRAVRLVVDTGIHSLGWSQKKAISYAKDHLASDAKQIETEINRYSVWPGQALAYKIGQMKILSLRKKAEKELGSRFDIKEFHKTVIGNGTVSLGVLETQVNDWILRTKSESPTIQ